jgi:hypothetical protein
VRWVSLAPIPARSRLAQNKRRSTLNGGGLRGVRLPKVVQAANIAQERDDVVDVARLGSVDERRLRVRVSSCHEKRGGAG